MGNEEGFVLMLHPVWQGKRMRVRGPKDKDFRQPGSIVQLYYCLPLAVTSGIRDFLLSLIPCLSLSPPLSPPCCTLVLLHCVRTCLQSSVMLHLLAQRGGRERERGGKEPMTRTEANSLTGGCERQFISVHLRTSLPVSLVSRLSSAHGRRAG